MKATAALVVAALVASCRTAVLPRRYEVGIRAMAFLPARLTVAVGDTVVWSDHDIVPHTATSDQAGGWEVGPIMGGMSATWVATAPGEYAYHCRFHPVMHGTLVVTAQR